MNTPLHLRYDHTDHSRLPIDARSRPSVEIPWMDCYCVGFRISTVSHDRYQYALVIADDHEELTYGIKREIELIRAQPSELPLQAVDVVYVRNLKTQDPDFMNPTDVDEVRMHTQETLCKRDDEHFVVFGLIGDSKIILMDMHTNDAISAIRLARYEHAKTFTQKFTTLEVRHAHPVASEFDALSQMTFERMKSLEDSSVSGSTYLN
ncbi:MAG: hypothetical protein PXX77_04250 [Gallionella sp.]|nr:hypothetical protein [Gallionella sp.]